MKVLVLSREEELASLELDGDHKVAVMSELGKRVEEIHELVEHVSKQRAEVLVLGPELPQDLIFEISKRMRATHPEIDVVAYCPADGSFLARAMKEGLRDVVAPEQGIEELKRSISLIAEAKRLLTQHIQQATGDANDRGIITVFGPKGGSGKTTMAVNIAFELARLAPNEVVLVDLDLFAGEVADLLQIDAESSIASVANTQSLKDATGMKLSLSQHPSGLLVLPAPNSISEIERIEEGAIKEVIEVLGESFKYVVLDTGPGSTDATIDAVAAASDLVAVLSPEVGAIRAMQRHLEAFSALNLVNHKKHIVLNKNDPKTGMDTGSAEAVLMMPISYTVAYDRSIPVAGNQGIPFLETAVKGQAQAAIRELIDAVAGLQADGPSVPEKSSRKRRK